MDDSGIARLLRLQDGVVSRRQVLEHGGDDVVIERRVRRREWASILTGVYVAHTGPPSWRQRAWAAVLYSAPAVLSGAAALRAHGVRGHDEADPSRSPSSRLVGGGPFRASSSDAWPTTTG